MTRPFPAATRAAIVASAISAAALLACGPAAAASQAGAALSDLRVQLYALDPSSSDAPTVSFDGIGGSLARVDAMSSPSSDPATASASGGAAFAPVQASQWAGTDAGGSAMISGDAFDGVGAAAAVSASADRADSSSEASAFFGDGDSDTSFTLSPHSLVVISMMADLSASAGSDPADYAIGSAQLEFIGSLGDNSQESLANALVAAGGMLGAGGTLHEWLTVSFLNPYDTAISGTFFGGIDATAVASPAPEPTTLALMLAALAALAAKALPRRTAARAR